MNDRNFFLFSALVFGLAAGWELIALTGFKSDNKAKNWTAAFMVFNLTMAVTAGVQFVRTPAPQSPKLIESSLADNR